LEEPRRLELGHDTALDAAERVEERALNCIRRLFARAELVQAVPEDLVGVLLVEAPRHLCFGGDGALDARCTAYGRNCDQIFIPRWKIDGAPRPGTPELRSSVTSSPRATHPKGSTRLFYERLTLRA